MGMQLLVKASKPPTLTVTPTLVTLTAPGNVTAFVVNENKTLINAFTLGVVGHLLEGKTCGLVCNFFGLYRPCMLLLMCQFIQVEVRKS